MSDKTHNGWKNYETWLIALWIDNEQCLQEEAHEIARQNNTGETYDLAHALKNWVEDWPEVSEVIERGSFVSDMLNAAMSEIDWYELAEHYQEDIKDEDEGDDEE